MSARRHSYYDISPEEVQVLIRAARVERARAIRRALQALFRWHRKDDVWLDRKARAASFTPCR